MCRCWLALPGVHTGQLPWELMRKSDLGCIRVQEASASKMSAPRVTADIHLQTTVLADIRLTLTALHYTLSSRIHKSTRALRDHKPLPIPKVETKVIRDLNPDFGINLDPDVHWICPKLWWMYSCRYQSFHQVWYKSAVDCIRNANKCTKIPYSIIMKKMKKWSGVHRRIRIAIIWYSRV